MNTQGESKPPSVSEMNKQGGDKSWNIYGAQPGVWTINMLIALDKGVKGNKWFSLIDKVYAERTLELAWEKVKSNAGACGVDNISVGFFDKDSQSRLLAVNEHLREGTYQPQAIRRVYIEKEGGREKRPLGIPTVRDRIVETALKMVIEPIFEREFAPSSYGFRPGRGCKDALREVEKLLYEGYVHVVDVDIKSYFDCIPHDRLMELVKDHVADGRVLGLIESFLKQGILEAGNLMEAKEGSPQGGVISPLLANIYLNPLDWLLSDLGIKFARYADDIVILTRSEEDAREALQRVRQWMEQACLTLHPEKTRIVDLRETKAYFDFLGYRFTRSQRTGKVVRLARPKSVKKLRTKLKKWTRRNNGRCMEASIKKINPILRGWYGYFKHVNRHQMISLDGWVRMRLRSILRKRRKGKGRGRGADHRRWPNHYFVKLGLFSLERAKEEEISLRRGAKC
jgi:RNA-directed DNA polymerase